VTHDQIEAMTMATHVGVLDQGRLVQFGTPREIYEDPSSIYVATRLGLPRINILPADLFGSAPTGASHIGLRPEHIQEGDGQEARVARVEHLGDQTRLHLEMGPHKITSLADTGHSHVAGDMIKIAPRNPLYFEESGARHR
jgi:multiple sugar transport system ATP-binding protein